jgi:hypothetical protein
MSPLLRIAAGLVLCVVVLAAARAADPVAPEKLLAKESLLYLRYDGLDAHRKAYDQTVLARLMREDLGELVGYLVKLGQDALGPEVLSKRLLAGATPGRLLKLQKAAKGLPDVLEFLHRHGALLGVEVIDPMPPRAQATLIFPGAGKTEKYRDGILGAVRFAALLANAELETKKLEGREVLSVERDGMKLACWQEGEHVLLTFGTEEISHTLALAQGKRPDLTANEQFKQLAAFQGYETWLRGYADIRGAQKIAEKFYPPPLAGPISSIVEKLGLKGLGNLSLHSGCEGAYLRQTVMLETSGNRTGLLRILNTPQPIAPEQLPSLPEDVTSFYATRIDWNTTFKAALEAFQEIVKVASPGLDQAVPADLIKEIENAQSALGSGLVLYNAPSEGPLSLGYGLALEVKDPAKLKTSIEISLRKAAAQAGAEYETKTRKYRGVDLYVIQPHQRMLPFTPAYTIHNGWFVVALNPQPVQAYIMRTTGKDFRSWKPLAVVSQAVASRAVTSASSVGNVKVTSISYADPRPSVELVLNWAPLLVGYAKAFGAPTQGFDVSLVPNTRSVNDLIGPRVTVGLDDGRTLRWERTSTFPLEMSFAEMYGLFALYGGIAVKSADKPLAIEEPLIEIVPNEYVEEEIELERPPRRSPRGVGFQPANPASDPLPPAGAYRPSTVRRCDR